ncbi:UAP56-interacting factor-like [Cynoglossus semilaevis]|uniref:UAP56-interacting factor-like n=1 Tax=Cynoglossus semilaevis TaxID=244447 RepID=UPI0007DC8AD4|nr:UAP56-interacting factor-like [Cynoglossus semilaevis]
MKLDEQKGKRLAVSFHTVLCRVLLSPFLPDICRPLPPVQQTRRDARQATFLFRRGLKVQAQLQKTNPPVRTRQWRTSTAGSGILTVSIDNPTARTQPE